MRPLVKISVLLVLLQSNSGNGHAQTSRDTFYVEDVPTYVGKEFSAGEMNRIRQAKERRNRSNYGLEHRGFDFTTTDGQHVTIASSLGKVSLFAFWDATSHYKLDRLRDLQRTYRANDDFQLIVTAFDTSGLSNVPEEERAGINFSKISSSEEMRRLNYGNGYPSFIILNKANVICHIGSLWDLDAGLEVLFTLLEPK